MITLFLTSRVKDNPDSDINTFLRSLESCGGTESNCEVLIKYDRDDDEAPDREYFSKFPFTIKTFTWNRGEGRHSLHLDYAYLFAQRNPASRFQFLCADDFTLTRKGFIDDILSIDDDYCFVGPNRPRVEVYRGQWRDPSIMATWKHNEGVSLPVISTRCVEVLQNYGWHAGVDNWVTLLTIMMFESYKIDMWKSIEPWYTRNPTDGISGYGPTYNNMEMDGYRNPENHYYYDLVAQQAKNLYLNLMSEKLIEKLEQHKELIQK